LLGSSAVAFMTILALRDYQRDAVEAVEAAWRGGMRRPAVVLPTGAGKTVVFAHLVARWLAANPGRRAVVLAHRTELVEQATAKLRTVAPDLKVGIVKAERNHTLAPIVVASVATLASERRRRQLLNVGLVVVDECHHATARTYIEVLTHFGCLGGQEGAVAVGFTATMSRGDGTALGSVWQDVVYTRSIAEMISGGYLVRPYGKRVKVDDLHLDKVRRSRGDYSEGALGEALEQSMAPEAAAKAYAEHAGLGNALLRPGLLFAPTVSSATAFCDAFRDAGFSTGLVHGEQPTAERRRELDKLTAGETQVMCNCMVLTEGTDLPLISAVVVARPTTHAGLYVQMVGRGLRPYPGKLDALVLDIVGASQRHALTSQVDLFGEQDPDEPGDDAESADDDAELDEGELTLGAGLGIDDPSWVNGPLVSEDVDLFHGSHSAWLRTRGGTWFLPAGERYVAIVPAPTGGYDVVAMHRYVVGQSRWVMRDVSDLSYAMAWAEGDVTPAEQLTARRERSWRARGPSQAQRSLAARYGIMIHEGMLSGEVSGLISVAMATARIDSRMSLYLRSRT